MAVSDQYLEPNSLCVCPQNQNKTKSERERSADNLFCHICTFSSL